MQDKDYKATVLPPDIKTRVSVEAGVTQGWERYVGDKGISIGIETFGESAPSAQLFEKFGFNVQNIIEKCERLMAKITH
jgi:transketolase